MSIIGKSVKLTYLHWQNPTEQYGTRNPYVQQCLARREPLFHQLTDLKLLRRVGWGEVRCCQQMIYREICKAQSKEETSTEQVTPALTTIPTFWVCRSQYNTRKTYKINSAYFNAQFKVSAYVLHKRFHQPIS